MSENLMLDPRYVKILNLEQNSPEWYEFRTDKIGASEFASLAGVKGLSSNKFNSTYYSMLYKKLKDKYRPNSSNWQSLAMEIGSVSEDYLRDFLFTEHGIEAIPAVVQSLEHEYIFSSLDGIDLYKDLLVEIKTTSHPATPEEIVSLIEYYTFQVIQQYLVLGDIKQKNNQIAVIAILNLLNFNGFNFKECIDFYPVYRDFHDTYRIGFSHIGLEDKIIKLSREKWLEMCSDFIKDLRELEIELYINRPERVIEMKELKTPRDFSDIKSKIISHMLKIDSGGSKSLLEKYLK